MGGECNYLLRVNPSSKHLEFVPDEEWMTPEMLAWDEEDIKVGLAIAYWLLLHSGASCTVSLSLLRVCHIESATQRARIALLQLHATHCCECRCAVVQELLDDAQLQLLEGAARLCMPVQLIRKTRSVGVVPTQPTIYEVCCWVQCTFW